jgi:SprT protein
METRAQNIVFLFAYLCWCKRCVIINKMNLSDVQNEAQELMNKYGLPEQGWTFGFDRAKTRCGCTDYERRRITVSVPYVTDPTVSQGDIVNTILHEIAHVLAGYEAAHGVYWQTIAKLIGCDGQTCNANWRGAPCKFRLLCWCGRVNVGRHIIQERLKRKRCAYCNTLQIVKLL